MFGNKTKDASKYFCPFWLKNWVIGYLAFAGREFPCMQFLGHINAAAFFEARASIFQELKSLMPLRRIDDKRTINVEVIVFF